MRFLAVISLIFTYVSVPVSSLKGTVFVDNNGTLQLTDDEEVGGLMSPKRAYLFGQSLYFSRLSQESLEDIPGIGPSLAKKIMVLREENMFPKWSDIDAISGIGSKKLAVLKENLILDE